MSDVAAVGAPQAQATAPRRKGLTDRARAERRLGMRRALVMHRALVGRGLVRTAALIPYGIVTVVAAFAWRFAWSSAEGGFVPKALGWTFDPTAPTEKFWNYVIVIATEVWKT